MTKQELTEKIVQLGGTVTGEEPMPDLWIMYNNLKPEKEKTNPVINTEEKISEAFRLTAVVVEHEKQIKFLKIALITVVVIVIGGVIVLIIKRK